MLCSRFLVPCCVMPQETDVTRSQSGKKDVACVKEIFRVNCPLVHLQHLPPKNHPRDVQLSFIGNNGIWAYITIRRSLEVQSMIWKIPFMSPYIGRLKYVSKTYNKIIYVNILAMFKIHHQYVCNIWTDLYRIKDAALWDYLIMN